MRVAADEAACASATCRGRHACQSPRWERTFAAQHYIRECRGDAMPIPACQGKMRKRARRTCRRPRTRLSRSNSHAYDDTCFRRTARRRRWHAVRRPRSAPCHRAVQTRNARLALRVSCRVGGGRPTTPVSARLISSASGPRSSPLARPRTALRHVSSCAFSRINGACQHAADLAAVILEEER